MLFKIVQNVINIFCKKNLFIDRPTLSLHEMLCYVVLHKYADCSVREVRRTRRTCPANFQNVRRRAAVKFNEMSGEKLQMSGEAKKDFAYTVQKLIKREGNIPGEHGRSYLIIIIGTTFCSTPRHYSTSYIK